MAGIYEARYEELGSVYVPKTIAKILVDVSMIDDISRKVMILEFHVQTLEEEMRRVGTFMRPLPYSIHFLQDAIQIMKQEIQKWEKRKTNPVLKGCFEGCLGAKESNDIIEKKECMGSVQLWNTHIQYHNNFGTKNQHSLSHHKSNYEGFQARGNFNHKAGAFTPYKNPTKKNKGVDPASSSAVESEVAPIDLNVKRKYPKQKKERRCWSPELHKQFVDALQQLGGVKSATPKKIREIMNVKGLTNDEVKSHLQKYRVYIRKLPSSARQLSYS